MDDTEFQDITKKLSEYHARIMMLIARMPPLTEQQVQKIAQMLARITREYDERVKFRADIKTKGEIAREAWMAARRAAREGELENHRKKQWNNWRNMLVALAIVCAILLVLKARF
jgi:hypothetical protein